jgi:hypothetical protein
MGNRGRVYKNTFTACDDPDIRDTLGFPGRRSNPTLFFRTSMIRDHLKEQLGAAVETACTRIDGRSSLQNNVVC